MKKAEKIYTITLFTDLGDPKCGPVPSRIAGWFSNIETALQAVRENWGDLNETVYPYAMVEECPEGVFEPAAGPECRWLFEYDRDDQMYHQIEEPEWLNRFCGFSIG